MAGGRLQKVFVVVRFFLVLDPLVFSVNEFMTVCISLAVSLESLPSALSCQNSNLRTVLGNPYWTEALAEHLRDLCDRCLCLWNKCLFSQLTEAVSLCLRDLGFVVIMHTLLLIKKYCRSYIKYYKGCANHLYLLETHTYLSRSHSD